MRRSTAGCIVTSTRVAAVRAGPMDVTSPIARIARIAVAIDNVPGVRTVDLYVAQVRVNGVIGPGYVDPVASVSNDGGATADDGDGDVGGQIDHIAALYMYGIRVPVDEDSVGSAQVDGIGRTAKGSSRSAAETDRVAGTGDLIVSGIRTELH